MALRGVKVVEMAGLAPVPFCGMILSDFGAQVIRVDKPNSPHLDVCSRGKRSIAVDLKKPEGVSVVKRLCSSADVLIEPFRAGVMEKLGLGPNTLLESNPRLVYARLTGFGQTGPLSQRAGHDINYLAISGVLSKLGRSKQKPHFPVNLLADFAGGGMTCAMGILMALFERSRSGQGQVVDCNMVEGAAYVSSFLWLSQQMSNLPIWGKPRGENLLDGGAHFYDTYETKDGEYMSVGAIEPQFYMQLLNGLGLSPDEAPQFTADVASVKQKFTEIFKSKTQAEWTEIFKDSDACVMPILQLNDAHAHAHAVENNSFINTPSGGKVPKPAPNLGRTPGVSVAGSNPGIGDHTLEVLKEYGFQSMETKNLVENGVVVQNKDSKSKL